MSIPAFYDKTKPPEVQKKANPMNIQVQVIKKNIDFVNTISMYVGLTMEMFS